MTKHIKSLLSTILPQQPSWKLFLLQEWDTIIGDLKVQLRLEKIQSDTLILSVSNASWMQELHCLSDILIKKINAKLDKPYIKKIRFKCSQPKRRDLNALKKNSPVIHYAEVSLTTRQQKALEKINDIHLQEALKKFLFRCIHTNNQL